MPTLVLSPDMSLVVLQQTGGILGPLRWTSKIVPFPFAMGEPTPMVIGVAHDIRTKEGHLSLAAKLSSNFDGKLMLPSEGDPVATLVASHRYGDGGGRYR